MKKLCVIMVIFLLLCNPAYASNEIPLVNYADLKDHWAAFSAGMLGALDIIVGERIMDRRYFYPDVKVNRADFILFMNSAMGISPIQPQEKIFFDNDIPDFLLPHAMAAFKNGYIKGVSDNGLLYLNPNEQLTRIEMIKMLNDALKLPDVEKNMQFSDMRQVPDWGMQALKNMESFGIIKGYDDGTIRPNEKINRAQAAEALYQAYKYKTTLENSSLIEQIVHPINMIKNRS